MILFYSPESEARLILPEASGFLQNNFEPTLTENVAILKEAFTVLILGTSIFIIITIVIIIY